MHSYYHRMPASAAYRMFDGRDYADTYYDMDTRGLFIVDKPRMMRVAFITGRQAYVLLGRRGDALALTSVPDDVLDHRVNLAELGA